MSPRVGEADNALPAETSGCDPNALLDRFRAALAVVSDTAGAYYADEDQEHAQSETAKFYDEIAEQYREAAEAMELLDEQLSDGGRMPDAWRVG